MSDWCKQHFLIAGAAPASSPGVRKKGEGGQSEEQARQCELQEPFRRSWRRKVEHVLRDFIVLDEGILQALCEVELGLLAQQRVVEVIEVLTPEPILNLEPWAKNKILGVS